jgi:NADH-quinone oxidoreductase subunit N
MQNELTSLLPELVLTAALLAAIIADLVVKQSAKVTAGIAALGFLGSAACVIMRWGEQVSLFSNMMAVDPFSSFFKIVILLAALVVVFLSSWSSELHALRVRLGEFYALLVALTLGLLLMTGANNLLMMYLALELSSLSSYVLSGYTREAPGSSEASLKYVIFGAFSSGLMIYGISILYGLTGSLDLAVVNRVLPVIVAKGGGSLYALVIASVLTMAGFGYKISAVPFHFWTPDVYEGAPISITAYLSVGSKAAGFAMLIRFLKLVFIGPAAAVDSAAWTVLAGFDWRSFLAVLAVITMTVGNVIALWQTNLKRMLAYSSIAHAGYLLSGLVVLNNEGLSAIMLYFVIYLFMNLGAFFVVMLIGNKIGSDDIEDYKGLGPKAPVLGVCLALFLVSLTGLPPTAGFIGKLYLFAALVNNGWVWLAVVGALNSVVALYYYIRVLKQMYFEQSEHAELLGIPAAQHAVVLALAVPVLLLGIYFSPLATLAQQSVKIFGTP